MNNVEVNSSTVKEQPISTMDFEETSQTVSTSREIKPQIAQIKQKIGHTYELQTSSLKEKMHKHAQLSPMEQAKAVLNYYTQENSRLARIAGGHWNRHHINGVAEIVRRMELGEQDKDHIKDIDSLIKELDDKFTTVMRSGGTLSKYISYIRNEIAPSVDHKELSISSTINTREKMKHIRDSGENASDNLSPLERARILLIDYAKGGNSLKQLFSGRHHMKEVEDIVKNIGMADHQINTVEKLILELESRFPNRNPSGDLSKCIIYMREELNTDAAPKNPTTP